MRADNEQKHLIHLVFNDGERIRSLEARSEQEMSEMLDHIRARGYVLIAIEGIPPRSESSQQN